MASKTPAGTSPPRRSRPNRSLAALESAAIADLSAEFLTGPHLGNSLIDDFLLADHQDYVDDDVHPLAISQATA